MPVFSYEQLKKLNPGEFRVYNFIVSHLDSVPEMNIRQIAEGVGVSTTTVLRFCEKAGCSGYTELKYRIRQELDTPDRNGKFDIDPAIQYMKTSIKDEIFADKMAQAAKVCVDAGQIGIHRRRRIRNRLPGRRMSACSSCSLILGKRRRHDFPDQSLQKSRRIPDQRDKYPALSGCTDVGY